MIFAIIALCGLLWLLTSALLDFRWADAGAAYIVYLACIAYIS